MSVIGENNIRPACKHRPYICSLHFEEKYFNKSIQRTRLNPDAVPTLQLKFKKNTVAQNRNKSLINTVINEAVERAESLQKTSAVAQIPPLLVKVQPSVTPAPKGSTCLDCTDPHNITLTPLVMVDIPPGPPSAVETVTPVIDKAKSTYETNKESRLRSRCTYLNKQLKAWRQKERRRTATINKLEAEKKELIEQHKQTIELLKSGDSRDHQFEDILHKAVMKLS